MTQRTDNQIELATLRLTIRFPECNDVQYDADHDAFFIKRMNALNLVMMFDDVMTIDIDA